MMKRKPKTMNILHCKRLRLKWLIATIRATLPITAPTETTTSECQALVVKMSKMTASGFEDLKYVTSHVGGCAEGERTPLYQTCEIAFGLTPKWKHSLHGHAGDVH